MTRGPCRVCGQPIPDTAGPRAATCGKACSCELNRRRERERYQAIRDTETWRAKRAEYLNILRDRRNGAPEFDEAYRAARRAANARWRAAVKADPQRVAEFRARRQALRDAMTPERRAAERATKRAWYASLSRAERVRIYYAAQALRALERLQGIAADLGRRAGAQTHKPDTSHG